jgi:hypothetical protein
VATAPSWGRQPPNARRRWRQRGRAKLHHLRRSAISRRGGRRRRSGLLRSSRFLRRHRRHGAQRHHHHRRSQDHKPHPRRQERQLSVFNRLPTEGYTQGGKFWVRRRRDQELEGARNTELRQVQSARCVTPYVLYGGFVLPLV